MMPRVGVCPEVDLLLLPMAFDKGTCLAQRAKISKTVQTKDSMEKGCISGRAQSEKQPSQAGGGNPGGFWAGDREPVWLTWGVAQLSPLKEKLQGGPEDNLALSDSENGHHPYPDPSPCHI